MAMRPASSGASSTGTKLAPAQQAPRRVPAANPPRMLAAPAVGDAVAAASRCERMKTLATASRCASASSCPVSAPPRTRTTTPGAASSLRDANHGATLDSIFAIGVPHLFCDTHGFFDQCLNNLILRDSLDDLAPDKDLALAVAGGNAEIGLSGLAGTIDHAAHNCHAQRDLHPFQASGDLLSERVHIHLGTATGRAGDDF